MTKVSCCILGNSLVLIPVVPPASSHIVIEKPKRERRGGEALGFRGALCAN